MDAHLLHIRDGLFSEASHPIVLAVQADRPMASLRHHVSDVLSLRSQEQMIRITARAVVAAMANFHSLRDRAAISHPCVTMDFLGLLPMPTEDAVSLAIDRAVPNPAAGQRLRDEVVIEPLVGRHYPTFTVSVVPPLSRVQPGTALPSSMAFLISTSLGLAT